MYRGMDSRTDQGTVKIHKNVIASVAAIAAGEIEGVKYIGQDSKCGFLDLIGRKKTPAIKVEINKNEEVCLQIPLVVKYGFNIPEVASRVQDNVRVALEQTTNLVVKDVDVNVQGIERG